MEKAAAEKAEKEAAEKAAAEKAAAEKAEAEVPLFLHKFCPSLPMICGVMLSISATGTTSNFSEDTCICPTFSCFVARGN